MPKAARFREPPGCDLPAGGRVTRRVRGLSESFSARCLLLTSAILIAYLPALRAGFVWDDFAAIHSNALLRTPAGLRDIWLTVGLIENESHYWPVLYTLYWVEYQLWGPNAMGYHAVNVALHAATACLFLSILSRLLVPGALFAAFLFALHPVQVEAVAWVHGCKNVLSACFGLGCVAVFLARRASPDAAWVTLSMVLLAAAVLSKTTAFVFPGALVLVLWWKRWRPARPEVAWLAGLLALGLALAVGDTLVARRIERADMNLDLARRLILGLRNLAFYLHQFVWPWPMMTIYPREAIPSRPEPSDWVRMLVMGGLAGAAAWSAFRHHVRWPAVALTWFVAAHLPSLGLADFRFLRFSWRADRFQYLPLLGLCAVAGAAFEHARRSALRVRTIPPRVVTALAVLPAAVFAGATFLQARHYRDLETLFLHNIRHNPAAAMPHAQVGAALLRRPGGDIASADRFTRAALSRDPESPTAWANLGIIHDRRGEVREAIAAYRRALALRPHALELKNDLAWHLAAAHDPGLRAPAEALRLIEEVSAAARNTSPETLDTLAVARAANGDFPGARDAARQALVLAVSSRRHALAEVIRRRLSGFERDSPWVEPISP